ncbi:hypothetical protein AB6A40_002541 [Gnathostoma spinigerum]|uniref:Uncharacterized protein n=1 Tax=Gnathostoma spinigerum TaxID=75299 RepID=A0ABD6EGZ4_9BILA
MPMTTNASSDLPEEEDNVCSDGSRFDPQECFHGRISKKEAERRLHESSIDGAFLLRTDHPSPDILCLSCLSQKSVMHYPITMVCGYYHLFGREFASLSDLLEEFVSSPTSPLKTPLSPPAKIEIQHRQRIAILPFSSVPDCDELSFCKGDMLMEIQQIDENWMWARLEKSRLHGLVAIRLTTPLSDYSDCSPEDLPIFHDDPLDVLALRLSERGAGSYLIRASSKQPDCYALMVNSGHRLEKFLIRHSSAGYEVGGRIFQSIISIIDRYSRTEICEGVRLNQAVMREDIAGTSSTIETDFSQLKRLHSHTSCPQAIVAAYAFRKIKDDKKWKSCYVRLSDRNGSQLYIFDNEKRAKPKLVLDLCYCFVYKIDESVLDRSNCLHIILNCLDSNSATYLSFQQESVFLKWFSHLRWRCLGNRHSHSPFTLVSSNSQRHLRSTTLVSIVVETYRGAGLKSELAYSACVLINGIRVCRTRAFTPAAKNCVLFDTPFLLEYIPSGSCNVQIQLCFHNICKNRQALVKENSHRETSSYLLPDDGEELRVSNECVEGFSFRATRHSIIILPEDQYSSFSALLQSHSFLICRWTASVLDSFHRSYFARLLLLYYLPTPSLLFSLIDVLLEIQLDAESEATLFRGDSFCACIISNALRIIGRGIALQELSPLLNELVSGKSETIDVDAFISALSNLVPRLPSLFGAVLSRVARGCAKHFPQSLVAMRRAVGAFFILRFINPMLAFWNVNGGPVRMLAKQVQNVTNVATAPDGESQSNSVSVISMCRILDSLGSISQEELHSENPFTGYGKAEYLALLAFEVERAFDNHVERCPLDETATVISLLKRNALLYISSS